jgi:hypothetical protein
MARLPFFAFDLRRIGQDYCRMGRLNLADAEYKPAATFCLLNGEEALMAARADVILRCELLRASKDDCRVVAHPSRRGREAAPSG